MKTDREMLVLAAKAGGLGKPYQWDGWPYPKKPLFINEQNDIVSFDALADDGDALRLAVKLHLTVRCYMGNTCVQATVPGGPSVMVDETDHVNPAAATRRAIVRAAAEIGERMP